MFKFKKIIIDETGLGAGVCDILKQKIPSRVEGIWYTSKSKAEMFNNLKLLLARPKQRLYIPDFTDNNNHMVRKMLYQFLSITQEFKEATSTPKISHEDREHDDLINALALAATYFNVRTKKRQYHFMGVGHI